MGCASCSIDGDGTPKGCGSNGHCGTGGCNKMNTYDWLSNLDLQDPTEYNMVEVSFKRGARKDFFVANPRTGAITGDLVAVEAGSGYDIGRISLSGELVRLQMRKKRVNEDRVLSKVLRIANNRDKERLEEARSREKAAMIRSRAIARTLNLDMKVGDVEFQGDNRKATFYYTADGRVDFRELVRSYANEFRVKIEMRQIGSRQESARIGGLGPCGRELCCSTWLSDFKSVSTSAARYQNLAINQTKLSGQCGRLKCCLNYELDSYLDALDTFPKKADRLRTAYHKYELIKTDIFKGLMYYIQVLERGRGPIIAMHKDRVKEILELNRKKEYPEELGASTYVNVAEEKEENDYNEELTGHIELPSVAKKKRGGRNNKKRRPDNRRNDKRGPKRPAKEEQGSRGPSNRSKPKPKREGKEGQEKRDRPSNEQRRDNRSSKPKPKRDNREGQDRKDRPTNEQRKNDGADKPKPKSNQRRNNKNRNRPPRPKDDNKSS